MTTIDSSARARAGGGLHGLGRANGTVRPAITVVLLWWLLTAAALAEQPAFPHAVTDGLADLRTEGFRDTAARRTRGRELLDAAVARQGGAAWSGHTTLSVTGVDRFREPGPWWPQKDQRGEFLMALGTFTSRVELLDGPGAGAVWGIQSWRPYRAASRTASVEFLEHDLPIEFYLPTLHYFNELPFRLAAAPIVVDLGTATLHGSTYDRVLVTWGQAAPSNDVDQYVAWIDRQSGLITKVHYTVREVASLPFIADEQKPVMRAGTAGTIHFDDFRQVGGVRLPFRHVVTLFGPAQSGPEPAKDERWVHIFEIENASFDAQPITVLRPDASLPAPADRKP